MALRELIAQKKGIQKRESFEKGIPATILQCFEIENIVTEAKSIYMFRHVTKAKYTLLDKTLSEINSVSNFHKATSHFVHRIFKFCTRKLSPMFHCGTRTRKLWFVISYIKNGLGYYT